MKIAFIRGPFLNPWELQSYLPLIDRHEFTAIGADWQLYPNGSMDRRLTVRRLPMWGGSSAHFHRNLPILLNRMRSWTLGESFGLDNLKETVAGFDILHPAELYSTTTYQCALLKKYLGCRLVVTVWENLPHMGETHPLRRRRKLASIAAADRILAVTETTRRMLLQEGVPTNKIDVIPMAVDLTRFTPQPRDLNLCAQLGIHENDLVILFVGRFVPEKGVLDLLQMAPSLLARRAAQSIRFLFVGEGPLLPEIVQAKKKMGDALRISSFRSYQDLPKIHNLADIFVLPSKAKPKWEEQFGYVLAESMASGKAIVTTRSGSIPDVVGDAAVLVDPDSPESLEAGLVRLLDPAERESLGQRALRRARDRFDAIKIAGQIEHMYQQACQHAL